MNYPRTPNLWLLICLAVLFISQPLVFARSQTDVDGLESRLGLTDLLAYRAALEGKPTAPDAPAAESVRQVSFHDLWDHPEAWQGHRVQVRGKVARIFRQSAVGAFPPLAEAWLSTPRGDLFCTVFPTTTVPAPGQEVVFSGTFLKTVRYAGDDQVRLAPCIVGNQPPASVSPAPPDAQRAIDGHSHPDPEWKLPVEHWSWTGWISGIVLGLAGAGVLVWQHAAVPWRAGNLERDEGLKDRPRLTLRWCSSKRSP